jgi:SnoaL-like domain
MPWAPELFTAPVLQDVLDRRRQDRLESVPYFDGFPMGEPDALVGSFVGEPMLFDPLRGRVKGEAAFRGFAARMSDWLARRNAEVEDVERVILGGRGGFEEVVVHFDGDAGRVSVPVAIRTDRRTDGRIEELRVYHDNRAMTGGHAGRQPLLQPRADPRSSDIATEHQRALAAGDVDAVVAAFEPDGYAREPGGARHAGRDALRAHYERMFSHGGGIEQEHCSILGDERICALEYNVVRWGRTELLPQAGVAVYARGPSGKLAAVRAYDDVEPPAGEK